MSHHEKSLRSRRIERENRSMVLAASSPDALLDLLDRCVPPAGEKWIDRAST
jgi:hypothetical protein